MAVTPLSTDESLRSQLAYGTPEFPFACYLDRFGARGAGSIAWHWHSEVEFSYVTEGAVVCHLGASCCVELSRGDGLFVNAGTIHGFEATGAAALASFVFSPAFIAAEQSAIFANCVQPVLGSDLECRVFFSENAADGRFSDLLEAVLRAAGDDGFGRELKVHQAVSALWLAFAEDVRGELRASSWRSGRGSHVRLQRMMAFVHDGYSRRLSLADIAASANVSESEALRCFRRGIGMTPVAYLNDYRLRRAAQLLLATTDSVAAVARAVGFSSAGYFSKAFKARYGASPREFRRGAA